MTDEEIAALPRRKSERILQQIIEKVTGTPICDQCHRRKATCTVPIFDVSAGAARHAMSGRPYRKEYWCPDCRAEVFDRGQEYAWGDARGSFLRRG